MNSSLVFFLGILQSYIVFDLLELTIACVKYSLAPQELEPYLYICEPFDGNLGTSKSNLSWGQSRLPHLFYTMA
jgi:hypothetical protein